MRQERTWATAKYVAALVIFGTLGVFVRGIALPSAALSLARGVMGTSFLLAFMRLSGRRLMLPESPRTRGLLVLSGISLALNWTFLFEAYRFTTLPTAELAYEMAPVIVMLASPFVLGERLSPAKLGCLLLAVCGLTLVLGVFEGGTAVGVTPLGVGLGLVAACFYATVTMLGRFLGEVDSYTKTVAQLSVAGLAMLPYVLATTSPSELSGMDARGIALLLVVGLVHTGIAFVLWFSSIGELPAHRIAILGYLDPTVALATSALFLGETLTPLGMVGAALILGSMALSELLG